MRDFIKTSYASKYLPSSPCFYKQKKKSQQEAHESIRPTDANTQNSDKLYKMIWKRSISSQMTPAEFARSTAMFKCKDYVLDVHGSYRDFDGWQKVWDYGTVSDTILPELKVGEEVKVINVVMEEKETKPNPRYSEASTIKKMEQLGIGRPSTFAATIDKLKKRNYIDSGKGKTIKVTDLGLKVTDFLVKSDFCFVDLQFTSDLESKLDDIVENKVDKISVLKDFWTRLKKDIEKSKEVKANLSKTDYDCPHCKKKGKQSKLLLKYSKYGKFYSCEHRKEYKCDYKANLEDGTGKPIEKVKKEIKESDKKCSNCGAKLIIRVSKKNKEYLGCRNWNKDKECLGFYSLDGEKIEFSKKKYKKKWSKK